MLKRIVRWLAIIAYAYIVVTEFTRIDQQTHSASDAIIGFAPEFVLLTIVLFIFLRLV